MRLSDVPNAGAPFSIGAAAWAASGGRPSVRLRLAAAEPSAARRPGCGPGPASAAMHTSAYSAAASISGAGMGRVAPSWRRPSVVFSGCNTLSAAYRSLGVVDVVVSTSAS